MVENKASSNKENEETTLQSLFQEAVRRYPHKTAAIFDDGETVSMVTYAEMQRCAKEVAVYLEQLQLQGEMIGFYYHASLSLPTVLLGILQTPAVFAPIDPHAPTNINKYFLRELNIRTVLVQEEVVQRFLDTIGSVLSVRVVQFLSDHGLVVMEIQHRAQDNPGTPTEVKPATSSQSLAYALHTSGTTGKPKIVRVPHSCIIPNVRHLREIFKIGPKDTTFMSSPLTFDASIVEIFMTLSQGATLVIVPMVIKLMPRVLANVLKKHHVTVIQATPTLISRFGKDLLQSHLLHATSTLRVMAFGGEICPAPSIIKQWRGNGNKTEFFNVYGITELSSWATYYKIPERDIEEGVTESLPLGLPLSETRIEIRDQGGQVVHGIGNEGELFIGGGRHCFIDEEDSVSMETMRATGDIVKMTERGLMYIGRHDNQIKRHGKRINLSQIQQLAETLDLIDSCSVLQDKQNKLVMCVVVSKQLHFQIKLQQQNTIRHQLREFLPEHGLPDDVIVVDKLPMTAHGKVDNDKLIKIIEVQSMEEEIPSYDKQHIQLLWKNALGISYPVEEYCKFLQEGGNSISALYFTDSIESWVKQSIPGLLDVVLHKAFHDVCLLVEQTMMNHKNTDLNKRTGRQKQKNENNRLSENRGRQKSNDEDVIKVKKMRKNGFVAITTDAERENSSLSCHQEAGEESKDVKSDAREDKTTPVQYPTPDWLAVGTDSYTSPDWPAISRGSNTPPDWLVISRGSHMETNFGLVSEPLKSQDGTEEFRGSFRDVKRGQISWEEVERREDTSFAKEILDTKMNLQMAWKCDTGKCVDASPLLVWNRTGGTVYIGSHSHKFMAISMATGEALWVTQLGDRVESSACLSKCGQYVVVGCYDGTVYIIDKDTGQIDWQYKTGDAVKSSPVVDPVTSQVIVGSHDHHLHAINIQDKCCVWRLYGGGGSIFSSPVIDTNPRMLYTATLTGRVLAVDPDSGDKKWHFDCCKPIFSSPGVTQHGCIIGCVDGQLYHLNHHGNKIWSFTTQGPIFSSPCIFPSIGQHGIPPANEYAVCGSHDCHVYCLSTNTGEVQWQFQAPSAVYATPFIFRMQYMNPKLQQQFTDQSVSQGCLAMNVKSPDIFTDDVKSDLYVAVGCTTGSVFILHLYTGQVISQYTLPGEVFSSPIVYGNRIFIGCRDDNVYCLEMTC